jgi:hypothetical protein
MKKPLRDPKVDHEWRTTFIAGQRSSVVILGGRSRGGDAQFLIRRSRRHAEANSRRVGAKRSGDGETKSGSLGPPRT